MEKANEYSENIYLMEELVNPEEQVAKNDNSSDINIEKNLPLISENKKEVKRCGEIIGLRERNLKVFEMSDGCKQAVYYSEDVHSINDKKSLPEEIDCSLLLDGQELINDKNNFIAHFSRDESNDELFSIESGMHKITVFAKKTQKQKNSGVIPNLYREEMEDYKPRDHLVYEDIERGTDYEYYIHGAGIKENIIIKERTNVYRYPFIIQQENVVASINEDSNTVSFISIETGEIVFSIPSPFMMDANGAISTAISYELKNLSKNESTLIITADSEWIDSEERHLPVRIDPQILVNAGINMTTYSWNNGTLYNASVHTIGKKCCDSGSCYANRMYLDFSLPTLPRNPRIKKAEIEFFQTQYKSECDDYFGIGMYQVNEELCAGNCTPSSDEDLIDFAVAKKGYCNECNTVSYKFDITKLIDRLNTGETNNPRLVLKMINENPTCDDYILLYGSSYGATYSPKLIITYESSYGVNTSYRTHTHSIGRFGQGSIDLQRGNLMFESEDFSWPGNRMPVKIKHLYNSALSAYQYTNNDSIKLNTADFSEMKIGNGFKLDIMQSMVNTRFQYDGETYDGYVYIDDNGDEHYFKQSNKEVCCESNSHCYKLYENVDDAETLYDPIKRILKQGEEDYEFDTRGRLIGIKDSNGNHLSITYTYNRITSVTDGAGRDFGFAYNSSGFLTSITAPDNKSILYAYTGNNLSMITYQDGTKAVISYSLSKPSMVTLIDANEKSLYRVAYSYVGDRIFSVTEFGCESEDFLMGSQSKYSYSAASNQTIVQTTELADFEECECEDKTIKTVYDFDDNGNVISEYAYFEDVGNVGVEGEESGIHPFSGDNGAGVVSNINNLAINHNFNDLNNWNGMDSNDNNFAITNYIYEPYAMFGRKVLRMYSNNSMIEENGVYQNTSVLSAGKYTLSAYVRVISSFTGNNPGVFIRVVSSTNEVLAISERIQKYDSKYVRLIAPFELLSADSVKIQILINGKGTAYVDAVQLENNPYANSYNMLENGNFERSDSWICSSGVYYSSTTRFNMSRSLMMIGDLSLERLAYQNIIVKKSRSTRETFTLSGWAKGYGLPNHERDNAQTPTFQLRAVVYYYDTYYREYGNETFTADFSPCTEEWQFASIQFSKSKFRTIDHISVFCDYSYNYGAVYFDDIQLVRNSIETDLSASDFAIESTGIDDGSGYEHDETPAFSEVKDCFGNSLTETTFTDGEFGTIYRSFGYTPDCNCAENAGNDLIRETDARGNNTHYTVDEDTSRNEEITDRCGNKTAYEYDAFGKTTKVISKDHENTELANVSYAYDSFDNMTEIVRGDGLKYALRYNAFHNLESIGIVGKDEKLVEYKYKTGNGRLKEIAYANGDKMKAAYNGIGQMISEKWFDSNDNITAHYKYVYDGKGNIVRSVDILSAKEYNYEYEEEKLLRSTESDIVLSEEIVISKSLVNTVNYYYDTDGKMTKKVISPKVGLVQTIYYENNDDNTVVKFNAGGKTITAHSKTDSFGRKVFDELQLGTGFVSRQFSYHVGEVTDEHRDNAKLKSSATTQLVSQIVLSDGRTISYEYDDEERITRVVDSVDGTTEYTYDALGQLLTETVNGVVINSMTYDNYGNILSKNNVDYSYDDPNWKDLLTSVGNQTISYDAQGNPTSYLGHTLTWEKGRQLKSFDSNTYTYNANGIRTSKTVNGIRHSYMLDGAKILRETWNGNTLIPMYDNEDSVCGIIYNSAPYYFQKNLQGDIVGIVDENANLVARYTYDAWGVPTIAYDESDCSIATVNPFRYRGYYYDSETELYYLQSRYYNSNVAGFINSDQAIFLGVGETILSYNLFMYCENSSLNFADPFGTDAYWITDTKVLGGLGHSSLLVYTNNAWYYFYFGAKQFYKPINGPANVIFEKLGITFIKNGKIDYAKLNKRLKNQDGNNVFTGKKKYQGTGYDKSIYIKGDFTSTYRYVNNTVKNMKYNILKENCSWLCIEVLHHSSISSSKKQQLANLQYHYSLQYVRISKYSMVSVLRIVKVPSIIVPSIVHNKIASIFA